MTQAHIDYMMSKIPMDRFGKADEIARARRLAVHRGVLVLDGRRLRSLGRPLDVLTA